jgi:hypothetical protein
MKVSPKNLCPQTHKKQARRRILAPFIAFGLAGAANGGQRWPRRSYERILVEFPFGSTLKAMPGRNAGIASGPGKLFFTNYTYSKNRLSSRIPFSICFSARITSLSLFSVRLSPLTATGAVFAGAGH